MSASFVSPALAFMAIRPPPANHLEAESLLGPDAPADPIARVERVVERITSQVAAHEPQLRSTLRLSLELPAPERDALVLRQGRALRWLEDALSPLQERLPEGAIRRLALAVRATIGIEAFVWLTDVGKLTSEEAVDLMRESARVLVRSALDDAPTSRAT